MPDRRTLAAGLLLAFGWGPAAVWAQLLEDVAVRSDGREATLELRLSTPVQYVRHAPARAGDLLRIEFQLVGAPTVDLNQYEEYRQPQAAGGLPSFRVTYPGTQGARAIKRFELRFAGPVRYRVVMGEGNRVLRVIVALPREAARTPPPAARPPAAPAAAATRATREGYVVTLARGTTPDLRTPPIPAALQDFEVFTDRQDADGQTIYSLKLGFFTSRADAERALAIVSRRFPSAEVTALGIAAPLAAAPAAPPLPPGAPEVPAPPPADGAPADGVPPAAPVAEGGVVVPPPIPMTRAPDAPEPDGAAADTRAAPTPPTPDELDRLGELGLARAQSAMQAGQFAVAVEFLNQVLTLPPNKYSRPAQAMAGDARARNGEPAKARVEYELYLQLYPNGPESIAVKAALADLGKPAAPVPAAESRRRETAGVSPIPLTVTGSLFQAYNRGNTKAETDTRTSAGAAADQASFSAVDQSSLVTNIDLNARVRTGDYDARLVFRDTNVQNFLENGRDTNQVTSAYFDVKHLAAQWSARLGRQTASTAGVLGRFDGLQASMQVAPSWRLGVVAGQPVEFTSFDSSRRFYGLTAEVGPFFERWSGSGYVIEQRIDSLVDRRAVGGDLRYFDANSSLYALVDYDVFYKELDIFLIQGARSFDGGWSLTGLYDQRKAPPMLTSNALLGETTTSIDQLLTTLSRDEVFALARARTADSKQAFLGLTKQFDATWQAGLDLRLSNIGELPPSGTLPATPSTGDVYTVSAQVTGTNLLGRRDLTVLNVSSIDSPTFVGHSATLNHLFVLAEKWTLEPSIRYYRQTDTAQVRLRRVSPTLRVYYRPRETISLEGELAWESTLTESETVTDETTRRFFSLGYRWDF